MQNEEVRVPFPCRCINLGEREKGFYHLFGMTICQEYVHVGSGGIRVLVNAP